MPRLSVLILLVLLARPVMGADAAPSLPAEIGDLTLRNGRVLRSVVVLSQTGLAINVRHTGGLMQIEKQALPPELLARFPVDQEQAKREEQLAAAARARREEQAQVGALWVVRPAQPGSRAAGKYAGPRPTANAEAPANVVPATRAATPGEQLARAPKGLYITTWSNLAGGEIKLEVVNPTGSAQKMEPRDLVALRLDDGGSVAGSDLRFPVQERADQWVDAGQRKSFRVQFLGGVAIAAVAWVGSAEWRVFGPGPEAAAVASEEAAMSLARANDKEAKERARKEANKARTAKAIDKLDDRLIGR